MAEVTLKAGREKSVLRRHPWIYSGAIQRVSGEPDLGGTVLIRSAAGQALAQGAYSPNSNIRVRIWTWDPDEAIDEDFFHRRLARAISTREMLSENTGWLERPTGAMRLVHGESDGLPGLIVDRYGDTLVFQCLSAGIERWRDVILGALQELTGISTVYERSDVDVRELEGLPSRMGLVRGTEPPPRLQILENGLSFWVDIRQGHKTGFYLDQRANRKRVREWARERDVLDCFCYTGGFTLNALAGGARTVTAVDTSAEAISTGRAQVELNGFPSERVTWIEADVFQSLRKLRDSSSSFDLIILDPPKFAPTTAQVERASRGYKDINLLAFKLLRPGGVLATFSCSGGVSEELFQQIVFSAALDAGADAQILERLHQDADHPVALNFPEGAYLKGFIVLKR